MAKSAGGLIPVIELDEERSTPLYEQLFTGLQVAIKTGRIAPGTRLPASRTLARDLDVSRTTVLEAFRKLRSEGYVESRVGDGTYVADTLPEESMRANLAPANTATVRSETNGAVPPAVSTSQSSPEESTHHRISRRGERMRSLAAAALPRDEVRPFLPGVPALSEFPRSIWQRRLENAMARIGARLLHYPDPQGHEPLRAAISEYLRVSRGLACSPEQVVITTGSQQAISILARLLLDPGDPTWFEDPGYPGARRALLAAGARLVPVSVDEEGIDVSAGVEREPRPAAVYVTPSHQFPLAVTMSETRRRQLLDMAARNDAWLIEDDYDGEYRFEDRPLSALRGLGDSERVVHVGTLSKMLFPALRLGYVVLPVELVSPYLAVRLVTEEAPSPVLQLATAEFIAEGDFARHIRRMRVMYRERRDALLAALEAECGDAVRPGPAAAGMHLSVGLGGDIDAGAVSAGCAARGVTAFSLSEFAIDRPGLNGLILGFAGYTPGEIRHAVRALGEVVRATTPG